MCLMKATRNESHKMENQNCIEVKMFITLALVRSDMVFDWAPEEPDVLKVTEVNEIIERQVFVEQITRNKV